MQIDHIPNEKRPTNRIWWVAWTLVALTWAGYIYAEGFSNLDWPQICLGGFTMSILATWSIEITGNKAPDWMIPRPRKRYLPPPVKGEPFLGSLFTRRNRRIGK